MKSISILLASISLSLAGAALLFESGFTTDNWHLSNDPSRQSPQNEAPPSLHSYGHLPMSFELNLGQVDRRVMFLSRGKSHSLFLTPSEAILQWTIADCRFPTDQVSSVGPSVAPRRGDFIAHESLPFLPLRRVAGEPGRAENGEVKNQRAKFVSRNLLRMKLVGSESHARLTGVHELPGRVHYLRGTNPNQQITNIPTFAQVRYENIYPGVDLVFYGNERKMEYDFVVSPGANPDTIRLSFEGQEKLEIDGDGELVLCTSWGEIRQPKPLIYQEVEGRRQLISGHYALKSPDEVAFQIDTFNHAQPLIIDPELIYSTYLGGEGSEEDATGIAVDSVGNAYITGTIASTDFPTTPGALQTTYGGGIYDAFVTKLSPSGSLIYSTYLGTSGGERTPQIAIDNSGNAYVAGTTFSTDFPTTSGALQRVIGGANDVFISKLNAAGSALVYSTFLGGSGIEEPARILIDTAGNAYVCGSTHSANFPTTNNAFQKVKGAGDAEDGFVAKINSQGSALVYSTFLGGSQPQGAFDAAIDSAGNAFVTGVTYSPNFPTTPGALQKNLRGSSDAFIAKLNPQGSALVYSTFFGGSGDEYGLGITMDSLGNAYVSGATTSSDFPTVNPFQTAKGSSSDAFVAKLNAAGSALVYSTFLGGSGDEGAGRIALDSSGNLWIAGNTNSVDFPVTQEALQATPGGGICHGIPCVDVFVVKLNAAGTGLLSSTYFGGSNDDFSTSLALDDKQQVVLCGFTTSQDFPVKNPLQSHLSNFSDPFVAKLIDSPGFSDNVTLFVPIVLSASGLNNSFYTSELAITNRSSRDTTLELTYTAAFGGGGGTAVLGLPAGRQRIVPDAIDFLRSIGVPIPESGNRGGTLSVSFRGISFSREAAITARTTTRVANGRAGLAYAGFPIDTGLTGVSYLCGLRQNSADRSNVAVQNMGKPGDGNVVLRLTVFSGDPAAPSSRVLPDVTLAPGGFVQFTGILASGGLSLTNGYVRVERVSGKAPYYADAVINDQANSDGSFVPPTPENALGWRPGLTLPVIVESSSFNSELVLTNWAARPKTLHLRYVADAIQTPNSETEFVIDLLPGEQRIIPNLVQYLREQAAIGIFPPGPTYAGPLFADRTGSSIEGIFIGARTAAPGGGGRYGLFYVAVPYRNATTSSTWLYGLQQNEENRTNLALVNTGELGEESDTFTIDIFDGETGVKVNSVEGITLRARHWLQIGAILTKYAPGVTQGYARVTRTTGSNPFITYAIVNDGGAPGERSGDGAYVSSEP